jgi:multidrug efflux system membrane fusion protein
MKRFRRYLSSALVIAIIAGVTYVLMTHAQQRPGTGGPGQGGRFRLGDQPVPVLAATAEAADVPVYLDGVGTTKALNTVTVRPQVDGKIISINFKEGQDVERGDVLAQIDPATYQAQLDQAVAKKAQDEAQLANARIDLERYIRLAKTNATTQQQADTQKALVAQLEAQIKVDQGAIDNAQTLLNYTTITAPIAARTGIRQVDIGNLVHANDATGIVILTQIKPISIIFTLPQQQFAKVNQAMAKGPLTVEALGDDNHTVIDRGTLQVIDNQVDPTTGTLRFKAEFPNLNVQLWPGQFVNVRLLVDTLKQVIVVPTAAVQRGPDGTFVYVVNPDNATVKMQPVKVQQQDDTRAVIASGLKAGDRTVTTGFNQLSDGSRIALAGATPTAQQPTAQPPTAEQPQRRRRGAQSGEAAPTSAGGHRRSEDTGAAAGTTR